MRTKSHSIFHHLLKIGDLNRMNERLLALHIYCSEQGFHFCPRTSKRIGRTPPTRHSIAQFKSTQLDLISSMLFNLRNWHVDSVSQKKIKFNALFLPWLIILALVNNLLLSEHMVKDVLMNASLYNHNLWWKERGVLCCKWNERNVILCTTSAPKWSEVALSLSPVHAFSNLSSQLLLHLLSIYKEQKPPERQELMDRMWQARVWMVSLFRWPLLKKGSLLTQ